MAKPLHKEGELVIWKHDNKPYKIDYIHIIEDGVFLYDILDDGGVFEQVREYELYNRSKKIKRILNFL